MATKHDQIAGSLVSDIITGRYRVGERLPSERDLSERFTAHRGAAREAMKKLEQLGLADVKPGGARVRDRSEASLDIIGHLLREGELPDPELVDQILLVISGLITIAARQLVQTQSLPGDHRVLTLLQSLYQDDLDRETHSLLRLELMQALLTGSQNLPLQLIAKTLFNQLAPSVVPYMQDQTEPDRLAYNQCARALELALLQTDPNAVQAALERFHELNRTTFRGAFNRHSQTAGDTTQTLNTKSKGAHLP